MARYFGILHVKISCDSISVCSVRGPTTPGHSIIPMIIIIIWHISIVSSVLCSPFALKRNRTGCVIETAFERIQSTEWSEIQFQFVSVTVRWMTCLLRRYRNDWIVLATVGIQFSSKTFYRSIACVRRAVCTFPSRFGQTTHAYRIDTQPKMEKRQKDDREREWKEEIHTRNRNRNKLNCVRCALYAHWADWPNEALTLEDLNQFMDLIYCTNRKFTGDGVCELCAHRIVSAATVHWMGARHTHTHTRTRQ